MKQRKSNPDLEESIILADLIHQELDRKDYPQEIKIGAVGRLLINLMHQTQEPNRDARDYFYLLSIIYDEESED